MEHQRLSARSRAAGERGGRKCLSMILAWDGCVARSVDNVEQNELLHTATGSEVGMERMGFATWPVMPRGSGRVRREAAEIQWSEWDSRPTFAKATACQA